MTITSPLSTIETPLHPLFSRGGSIRAVRAVPTATKVVRMEARLLPNRALRRIGWQSDRQSETNAGRTKFEDHPRPPALRPFSCGVPRFIRRGRLPRGTGRLPVPPSPRQSHFRFSGSILLIPVLAARKQTLTSNPVFRQLMPTPNAGALVSRRTVTRDELYRCRPMTPSACCIPHPHAYSVSMSGLGDL